jgi:hypothetical protein
MQAIKVEHERKKKIAKGCKINSNTEIKPRDKYVGKESITRHPMIYIKVQS